MMRRGGFTHKMEHWRNRPTRNNTLFDVYDGRMWKSVPDPRSTASNHILFVDTPFSLLLTLNIDCSKHSTRRPGTLLVLSTYMTVNNLPRTERYKKENTILVGVIPGPRESSKEQFNHNLRPLVDDLLKLYNGVPMTTFDGIQVNVRAALLMVA